MECFMQDELLKASLIACGSLVGCVILIAIAAYAAL